MSDLIHFEDFSPGQVYDLGALTVTREEIVEFASEFDPQPFHLDEDAGKASILGGLAASGWHTGSLVMRLLATNLLNKTSGRGSPGISKLQWKRPVFPGDTLTARAEILETKELRSKPDLGIVTVRVTAANQQGTEVLLWENPILFAKREPGS
ncbi:MaoC family dehydratase [Roseibium sediminicola]|uniref:MaoC family dehydratase n=1 Tax=Roseibium sediminicola TaxID=2933272 RepID=A0ABT0GSY2_9HYPH|nr:MaoC family dehydratase [Roseibium sp. CAU 1639]MCK7612541.1 MaoC family dehydratase [Roseibium sp. CAU 1639]